MIDLSSKVSIAYVDVRVFVHATEDIDKVLKAVYNTLPTQLADEIAFKKTNLKGYYRNPIILLETRIKKRDTAEAVFRKLASGLSSLDKELLNNEIKQRLSKGNLFIRLDKQSAYLNELKLRSDDPIHFRIHFRKSRLEEIMEICRKFGMLP
jgi:RNA binding exosome subunit